MTSLQKSKDQERAAKAWADVSNCLDNARIRLERDLRECKEKPSAQQDRDKIKDLENGLSELKKEDKAKKFRASYGRQARKIPAQIQTNGLGQTLAFLRSKGKGRHDREHQAVYDDISEWVTGQMGWSGSDLLNKILESDSATYRRATTEAIAYLIWLKRFAEAELPVENGGE